jgi:cell division septum initiation protein DivIVA
VQTTEFEIGRLFMEAQRFSEATLSRLEMQIQEILVEAEAKAAEILREANEDAERIRREAQQSSFIPARTAQELQSAIAGFASVNNELIRELSALNAMLAPSNRMAPPIDRSADRMHSL